MATLTLTLVTGAGTLTRSATCTDAEAQSILNAYAKVYAGPMGPLPVSPTFAQIFAAIFIGIVEGIKTVVASQGTVVTTGTPPSLA